MKMSTEMKQAIMFALQNSLAKQEDIIPVFDSWNLEVDGDEIVVTNPPVVEVSDEVARAFAAEPGVSGKLEFFKDED